METPDPLPIAILAGGLATRLRPITEKIPKSLVQVAGEPFIRHQLRLLRQKGITRVVLCAGHLGTMIQDEVGDGAAYGLHVAYSFDGPTLLGTAGALHHALPLLGEEFFVLYGDSYLDCDYAAVHRAYTALGKQALMTVFKNDNHYDASNIVFADGRILAYDKRTPTPAMQWIDYGLGIIAATALHNLKPGQPTDLADIYTALLRQDQLAGVEVPNRFYEIGSPAGLQELSQFLQSSSNS